MALADPHPPLLPLKVPSHWSRPNKSLAGNNDLTPTEAGKSYVRNPGGLCVLEAAQRVERRAPRLGVAAGASVDLRIYSWRRN